MADPIKDTNIEAGEADIEKEPEKDAPEGADGKPEEGKEEPEPEAEMEDDEAEPPVRRSVKDFIIERKTKKIEKLQKKGKTAEPEEEPESEEEPEPEVDLESTIKKHVEPIAQGVRAQADEMELRDVKAKYQDAPRYEKIMRRYMAHPAYKDVSVESIYFIVAGKYGSGGAAKGKEPVKQNITGGHQRRKPEKEGNLPDFDSMSDKELDDIAFKVKTGHRI